MRAADLYWPEITAENLIDNRAVKLSPWPSV
jgi:hypothetical protein